MPTINNYKNLPQEPGCYLFKDKSGVVLYVGKAKNLRKRVASYFTKKDHDPKTEMLISRIYNMDYFVTGNEIEALILENNLIKKYYPRFNIDLKDSRRYAYLRLTDDEFPFLEVARTREEPGQYFGPFVSGKYRKEIHKVLGRRFGILTQKPSSLKKKSLDREEYKLRLKKVMKILKGDVNEMIRNLKKEMKSASLAKNFEYALMLRNQIEALSYLKEKQHMELRRNYDSDIINFIIEEDKVYLLLFNIYKGVLENKQEFEFNVTDAFLEEFLLQYYSSHDVPQEIIIPRKIDPSMSGFLEKKKGKKVEIIIPEKGMKKALLELAMKNVKIALHGENMRVVELQKSLSLVKAPIIIECFDISHLRGTHTVASMVTFYKGKPQKSHYRKFRIRTVSDGDDFEAMREVIYRRYAKSLKETLSNPDLIVIDGGAGQLSSALGILKELKLDIPIISLAKKLEEIYIPGRKGPLRLSAKNQGLQLLRAVRDEAHRFAILYNRFLRKKAVRK